MGPVRRATTITKPARLASNHSAADREMHNRAREDLMRQIVMKVFSFARTSCATSGGTVAPA
jgi:hypothetical protein